MKARLSKPKSIEQGKASIVDEVNQLYLSKTVSGDAKSGISNLKNSVANQIPSNLKLAVAFLSGDIARGMNYRSTCKNSPTLASNVEFNATIQNGTLGAMTGVNQLEAVKQSQLTKESTKVDSNLKYLKFSRLTKSNYGDLNDRYAAINKKVETNIRLLQTDDYKIFQKIKKVQNLGGTSLTLSVPAFFMTVFAKGISNSVKLNLMKSALMFMFMTGGVLGHYTWKYSKFLDHLDKKYFYGASIQELQDNQLIKTNLPKTIAFEDSEWSLKSKFISPKSSREDSETSKKSYL